MVSSVRYLFFLLQFQNRFGQISKNIDLAEKIFRLQMTFWYCTTWLKDISIPDFSTPSFNPRPFNPWLFNHELSNPVFFNRWKVRSSKVHGWKVWGWKVWGWSLGLKSWNVLQPSLGRIVSQPYMLNHTISLCINWFY